MARTRRGKTAATRGSLAARVWNIARHPITFPLWAAAAALSFLTLHRERALGPVSLESLGQVFVETLGSAGAGAQTLTWSFDLYGVNEPGDEGTGKGGEAGSGGGAWRILDTNVSSADELTRLWSEQPERVVQVAVVLESESRGVVAFTHARLLDHVTFAPFTSRELTHEDEAAIRRAAVDHLLLVFPGAALESRYANRIARLRAGDVDRASRVWSGYAVDVGLPVGFVMAALSLARGVSIASGLPGVVRRRRRRRKALCTACAYPLTGVAGGVCPECGAPIPPTDQ